MLKLKTQLDIVKYSLCVKNFSDRGRPGGVGHPSVNLGPSNISENTTARKLTLKTPLDIVKYSPRAHKFFPYVTTWRTGGTGPPNLNLGPLKARKLLEVKC